MLHRGSILVILAGLLLSLGIHSGCARRNYLRDASPILSDRTIHVVIENPAGTQEKWEVRANGELIQERNAGGPIQIPYLPWPVNSGMIPRTLLSADLGGDGEPLDVLLLGPALPRGSLVRARPIGLLRIIDGLERDDKILAVQADTPLASVQDAEDLERKFPGVRSLLTTWFGQSRRGGGIQVLGYGSRAAAARLIAEGVQSFDRADKTGEMPEWITP